MNELTRYSFILLIGYTPSPHPRLVYGIFDFLYF